MTLALYGYLYADEMERLADQLDATHGAKPGMERHFLRHPGGADLIELPRGGPGRPPLTKGHWRHSTESASS